MCTQQSMELTQRPRAVSSSDSRPAEQASWPAPSDGRSSPGRRGLTRRSALLGGATVAATAVMGKPATASALARTPRSSAWRGLCDLTYPLTTRFPTYAADEAASRTTHVTIGDDGYYAQQWRLFEHTGTHVDAPGHFAAGGRLAPELELAELVTPAVVIDIAGRAERDPDTVVTVADLRAFERAHGCIPYGAAVLMYSGWGAKVGDPDAYRGPDKSGTMHFPGFGAEACDWLLRHRGIRSLGVDTLSIDPGNSTTFDVHLALARADRYGLENLANLDRLPPEGATVMVGLIPLEEGSGGPARVFAAW